jgi:hypothetical protein
MPLKVFARGWTAVDVNRLVRSRFVGEYLGRLCRHGMHLFFEFDVVLFLVIFILQTCMGTTHALHHSVQISISNCPHCGRQRRLYIHPTHHAIPIQELRSVLQSTGRNLLFWTERAVQALCTGHNQLQNPDRTVLRPVGGAG